MEVIEMAVVASIVVVCILYSAWRLTSAQLHVRVIDLLGKALGNGRSENASDGARLESWVARLRNRELSKLGGSCGSCASNVKVKVHGSGAKPSR